MSGPPRVTLFSYHHPSSKRRAGFHWIADACWRMGWDVVFVTAPISWLSRMKGNFRFEYPVGSIANRAVPMKERFTGYVLFTRFHPVSTPSALVNRLTGPLFARYANAPLGALEALVRTSDVVIMESTPAILLAPRIRRLIPDGRLVYRASDDLTFDHLATHPMVVRREPGLAGEFDLISAASHVTVERLAVPHAHHHPHGIARHLFDAAEDSPYAAGTTNLVWVGTKWMDDAFLEVASARLPSVDFQIIGPVPRTVSRPNVRYHGELPFEETVPFLRHADVGLSTFPGLASLGEGRSAQVRQIHSLKTTQYSYCGLPIVAPADLVIDRELVFPYEVSDEASVTAAVERAIAAGRASHLAGGVWSWDDLTRVLLGDA